METVQGAATRAYETLASTALGVTERTAAVAAPLGVASPQEVVERVKGTAAHVGNRVGLTREGDYMNTTPSAAVRG